MTKSFPKPLPKRCYVAIPGQPNAFGLVVLGIEGFYPCDMISGQDECDRLNEMLGNTPEVINAMLIGSMFGWNVPATTRVLGRLG